MREEPWVRGDGALLKVLRYPGGWQRGKRSKNGKISARGKRLARQTASCRLRLA